MGGGGRARVNKSWGRRVWLEDEAVSARVVPSKRGVMTGVNSQLGGGGVVRVLVWAMGSAVVKVRVLVFGVIVEEGPATVPGAGVAVEGTGLNREGWV